jgi:hypothetical protein
MMLCTGEGTMNKTAWLLKLNHWYLLPGEYLKPVTAWGHKFPIKTTDLNRILPLIPGTTPELVEVPVRVDEYEVTWYTLQLPQRYPGDTPRYREVSYKYLSQLHANACAARRVWYKEASELRNKYWQLEPKDCE